MSSLSEVAVPQAMRQYNVLQEASYSLLKKVLDMEKASVLKLLESLPPAQSSASAENNIDFYA